MSLVRTAPKSLFGDRAFLSRDQCKALFDRIVALGTGGGYTSVSLVSRWTGAATWARSRAMLNTDQQTIGITITREIRGAQGRVTTTATDDNSLREAIRSAEWTLKFSNEDIEPSPPRFINEPMLAPMLWDDATYILDSGERCEIARRMFEAADNANLLAAGTLKLSGQGHAAMNDVGLFRYYAITAVECSMSVRDPQGSASGWAGVNDYALKRIDPLAIGTRAFDKCQSMANPVACEPGRYTTILEPQAVHDLCAPLWTTQMWRSPAESMLGPFADRPGQSKISMVVIDQRLRLRADPMHPDTGFVPFQLSDGIPYQAVDWVREGVLRDLAYNRGYALGNLGESRSMLSPGSFWLGAEEGVPAVSTEEMIASTERGLLVSRLYGVEPVPNSGNSGLVSGYTRDGVWLIERGKITKPVKNFRFTESPLFALNNVEQIGPSVRVFSPDFARVLPTLKVRDFNLTSLADAV